MGPRLCLGPTAQLTRRIDAPSEGLAVRRVERECLLERGQCLLVASLIVVDPAQIEMGQRLPRVRGDQSTRGLLRLRPAAQTAQSVNALPYSPVELRVKGERLLERGQRLPVPTPIAQDEAQPDLRARVRRAIGGQLAGGFLRIVPAPQEAEHVNAGAERSGVFRIAGERLLMESECLLVALLPTEEAPEHHQGAGVRWIESARAGLGFRPAPQISQGVDDGLQDCRVLVI